MSCPSHWDPYAVPASRQPWRRASGFRGPTSPGAPRNVETKKCLVLFEGRHGPTICSVFIVFFCEVELRGGLNSEPALRRKACFPVASPYHSFNFELDGNVPENVYTLYNFHDRKVPRIGVQENCSVSAWPNVFLWSGCLGGS